jgi:hypothetical protein
MSEESPSRPVKITSTPRAHPAIRAIARACIALARWQRDKQQADAAAPAPPPVNEPPNSADSGTEAVRDA